MSALRFALLALALGCLAWAVVRSFGLDRAFPVVAMVTFTPYAAIGSLALVVVALASRAWVPAAVAVAALVLFTAAIAPRALGGPDTVSSKGGATLTVLALNLYRGEADPRAVVSLIDHSGADVVCLSELTPSSVRSLDAAGLSQLVPERGLAPAAGAAGTGIYSERKLQPLPGIAPGVGATPMAQARLRLDGGRYLNVVSVHVRAPIDSDSEPRWEDGLDALPAASAPGLQILAGDFNATLDHAELRDLIADGYTDAADKVGEGLSPTWPVIDSSVPLVTIDHVLAENGTAIHSFSTLEVPGTDHRAVIAKIAVP